MAKKAIFQRNVYNYYGSADPKVETPPPKQAGGGFNLLLGAAVLVLALVALPKVSATEATGAIHAVHPAPISGHGTSGGGNGFHWYHGLYAAGIFAGMIGAVLLAMRGFELYMHRRNDKKDAAQLVEAEDVKSLPASTVKALPSSRPLHKYQMNAQETQYQQQ
jgi:hypothetical protein